MKNKKELAKDYFKQGYNCSQAVFLAYAKDYGIDEEAAVKMSAGFGGGMGRMREVCGAVSGMVMVAGLETGTTDPKDAIGKKKNYEMVQEMSRLFKEKNRSIICRELLGLDKEKVELSVASTDKSTVSACLPTPEKRTEGYYKKRPCIDLVGDACDVIESVIALNQ